ncbi:unnamed protein product [Polarella glacialis]|uniref:Microbial-type PARG catalytic domain-containing protein n=1 Tax=Polarella glacialis TaxID=89957 RepID=A0A813LPC2_POLGL|nr:unnamed protein product [Polarella glacialis]
MGAVLGYGKSDPPAVQASDPGLDMDLLRQIVHPLFAELPEPRVDAPKVPRLKDKLPRILRSLSFERRRGSSGSNQVFRSISGISTSTSMTTSTSSRSESDAGGNFADTQSALSILAATILQELLAPLRSGATQQWRPIAFVTVPEDVPPELFLAALSVALVNQSLCRLPASTMVLSVSQPRLRQPMMSAWKEWRDLSRIDALFELGSLQPRSNSFSWLREDNSPNSRLERIAGAFSTLRQGGRLRSVTDMVANTQLLWPVRSSPAPRCKCTSVKHSTETVMEVARKKARMGLRVVAVNAASAYQVGGGFTSGGRHALEEAMCMQSTLFFSLQQAARLAEEKGLCDERGRRLHIPEDGAVLSPGVEVFREGTRRGYVSSGNVPDRLAAVVSVAMPNMNPAITSSPQEWRPQEACVLIIERKMHAMLQGAVMANAEVVVMPDLGCGIFGNNPAVVGECFGRVLTLYRGHFSEIILTGREEFYAAACGAVGLHCFFRHWERCREATEEMTVFGGACAEQALEVARNLVHGGAGSDEFSLLKDAEKLVFGVATVPPDRGQGQGPGMASQALAMCIPNLCCFTGIQTFGVRLLSELAFSRDTGVSRRPFLSRRL